MKNLRSCVLIAAVNSSLLLTACGSDVNTSKESSTVMTKTSAGVNAIKFVDLGQARTFNLFLFDDLSQPSADTEGAIAVGGNVNLANYSVGDKLNFNPDRYDLVVAGNLNFKSGAVSQGSAIVSGKSTLGAVSFAGKIDHGPSPINFKHAQVQLKNESLRLNSLKANGTTEFQNWGQPRGGLILSGNNRGLNIFEVNADILSRSYSIDISAPKNSRVLINVLGASASIKNLSINLKGISRNKVLFNLPHATQLHISGVSVEGSILAPSAKIDFPAGVVRGQIIAFSLFGRGQINNNPVDSDDNTDLPPPPPEAPEVPYE